MRGDFSIRVEAEPRNLGTDLGASRLDRSICVSTAYAGWRATVGQVTGNDSEQMVGADLVALWGVNAAYSTINVMTLVKQARERGAYVVVIDPYRTPTAQAADLHLAPLPGTDGALACAVMHVALRYGFADRGSVSLHLSEWLEHDPNRTASSVYFYVSDADALYSEWKALDLEGRLVPPFDTPVGRMGVIGDPQDAVFSIIQAASPQS